MIIYKDVIHGDEVISDTYNLIENKEAPGLWEVDCKNITVGNEKIELDGANPSAEGEDADEGGEGGGEQILDIAHSFRLQSIPRPEKKIAQAEFKKFAKKTLEVLKGEGKDDQAKKFQETAPAAIKKILGNWDNYDLYTTESMGDPGLWVLVDFRDDGITPYALFWRYALSEHKY